jgi:hypothetical protein
MDLALDRQVETDLVELRPSPIVSQQQPPEFKKHGRIGHRFIRQTDAREASIA